MLALKRAGLVSTFGTVYAAHIISSNHLPRYQVYPCLYSSPVPKEVHRGLRWNVPRREPVSDQGSQKEITESQTDGRETTNYIHGRKYIVRFDTCVIVRNGRLSGRLVAADLPCRIHRSR